MSSEIIQNCLILLSSNNALKRLLDDWLSPYGWACRQSADLSALNVSAAALPSLILVDGDTIQAERTDWIEAIRASDTDLATTPILLIAGNSDQGGAGISATIPAPPTRDATLAAIENWAGRLDVPGFRDLANPHYRLVRMGGRAVADGMLARFADQLEQALAWLDRPEPDARLPHQIAGIAGMLGYREISDHWRNIDADGDYDADAVRAELQSTIARIRRA